MKLNNRLLTLGILVLALGACSSGDLSTTDGGGVLLSITGLDGAPQTLSISTDVEATGILPNVDTITIQNISKNPSATTSELMNVELQTLEFTYTREDTGTRLPPKLVLSRPGVIPVNGTFAISNQVFMLNEQLEAQPLKDLADFGRDTETNSVFVRMRVTLRAFGRTLSGDAVQSAPVSFSIEIFQ